MVGPEVGAYNGFSERLVAADLRHLADWLEQTADQATGSVQLGPADEGIRLEHRGEGSLVVELRGELRPWYWEEPAEVVEFKLEVDAADLLQAALDLREELEAWLA